MTGMVGREGEGRDLGITHCWELLGMEEGLRVGHLESCSLWGSSQAPGLWFMPLQLLPCCLWTLSQLYGASLGSL